jgi:hypothetical protein
MKRFLVLLAVALIGAAYAGGYWPERQRRVALEGEVKALEERLAEAEARLRLAGLLARLLTLTDVVAEKNYGQALGLSSAFFDEVRVEAGRTPPAFRDLLEGILRRRDRVTASLTQAEPAVLGPLREAQVELRRALGFAPPVAPSPEPPAPAGSPPPAS